MKMLEFLLLVVPWLMTSNGRDLWADRVTQAAAKLPFALHTKTSSDDQVIAFEFEVYSRRPIGVVFNASFHVTSFDSAEQDSKKNGKTNARRRRGQGFSLAEASGQIKVGDQLVQINNVSLLDQDFQHFSNTVKEASSHPPVSYHFERRISTSSSDLRTTTPASQNDGTSPEPLLRLWRASSQTLKQRPSRHVHSSSESTDGSTTLEWTDLSITMPVVLAKFSKLVLTRHRFKLVQVTPADGCSRDLSPGLNAHQTNRRRRRQRTAEKRSRSESNIHNDAINGSILVVDRGGCAFDAKTHNAFDAGAAGVIVINTDDEAIEMDSPHMSHFGRRKLDYAADNDALKDVFPVVSVGRNHGNILRSHLSHEQRLSVASIYAEFSMPIDHHLRRDGDAAREQKIEKVVKHRLHSLAPAQSGEVLLPHLRSSTPEYDFAGDLIQRFGGATSPQASQVNDAIHFLTVAWAPPVLALNRSVAARTILEQLSQNQTGSSKNMSTFVATSLARNTELQHVLCEPMLLAAQVCPTDLAAAIGGRYVVFDNYTEVRCDLQDIFTMFELCTAAGVIVESPTATLQVLEPPRKLQIGGRRLVSVDATGNLPRKENQHDGELLVQIPVVVVSRLGFGRLKTYLSQMFNDTGVEEGDIAIVGTERHNHAWTELAPLQNANAWPPTALGRQRLLNRLHKRFGHSTEFLAAIENVARGIDEGETFREINDRAAQRTATKQKLKRSSRSEL